MPVFVKSITKEDPLATNPSKYVIAVLINAGVINKQEMTLTVDAANPTEAIKKAKEKLAAYAVALAKTIEESFVI